MPPVVAIVGHSRSGKTTLLERLIPEFKARGLRIATIKRTHKDIQVDQPGKDSWRFTEAGSDTVVVSGRHRLALIRPLRSEPALADLIHLLGAGHDLALVEGFHDAAVARIEVHRRGVAPDLRCAPDELLAVVTDEPLQVPCPQLSPEDVAQVADLITERVLGESEGDMTLVVNGVPVALGPVTQRFIRSTLVGMVGALEGIDEVKSLEVSLRTSSRRPAAP